MDKKTTDIDLEKQKTPEEKVRFALDYMRNCLSKGDKPNFKDFWSAKQLCITAFKNGLNSYSRDAFWKEFVELSSEGKKLQEIFDEHALFTEEQISLAIEAMEKDFENLQDHIDLSPEAFLDNKFYQKLQNELSLLNNLASRLNSLRKELLSVKIRSKIKSILFNRLGSLGDGVFPKRKTLILKIAEAFESDINLFVEKFNKKEEKRPLYELKQQIKDLQLMAKNLSLPTKTFSTVRLELSKIWDLIKELEDKKKKFLSEKKQAQKKDKDLIEEKINLYAKKIEEDPSQKLFKEQKELSSLILSTLEFKEDKQELISLLNKVSKPLIEQKKALKEREKENKLEVYFKKIDSIKELDSMEKIYQDFFTLSETVQAYSLDDEDFAVLEEKMSAVEDYIADKRNSLPVDTYDACSNLYNMEKQYKCKIKKRLEVYRKDYGRSGVDFAKGLRYKEILDKEKARLIKLDERLNELEEKLVDLE